MSETDNKKPRNDTETILMALDQISQTIDVMTSVVGRLRTYVQETEGRTQTEATSSTNAQVESNQTVH